MTSDYIKPAKKYGVDQEFIYLSKKVKYDSFGIDNRSLLLYGYIRETAIHLKLGYIPDDITNTILYFHGKLYYVHGDEPLETEYDYAIELLSPIKMLGINANMNRITLLTSNFAKKNIIYGSYIIQINDMNIKDKEDIDNSKIGELIIAAKQNTPSFIIFRCKKDSNKKGSHLQFDITYNNKIDRKTKFPYYKFTKQNVLSIFEKAFNNEEQIYIMEIYAEKECLNGLYGVSILLFIDNDSRIFRKQELKNKEDEIRMHINSDIIENCSVLFVEQLFGIKSNGINCSWTGKKSLYDMCYLVKGIDNGRNAWYYVMVDVERLDKFLIALNEDIIHLEDHGQILYSAYGDTPPENIKKILQDRYEGNN